MRERPPIVKHCFENSKLIMHLLYNELIASNAPEMMPKQDAWNPRNKKSLAATTWNDASLS
jgi:hypothetical protein